MFETFETSARERGRPSPKIGAPQIESTPVGPDEAAPTEVGAAEGAESRSVPQLNPRIAVVREKTPKTAQVGMEETTFFITRRVI
jgi:hypothetical protein